MLDDFFASFLSSGVYAPGRLIVCVDEGFRSAEAEELVLSGNVAEGLHAVSSSAASRRVEVVFVRPIAWQVVDESFTAWDAEEIRDDTSALQVLTRSRYLDYVHARHGWFEDTRGPAKHYRVWTENEVIDVVACDPPVVGLAAGE